MKLRVPPALIVISRPPVVVQIVPAASSEAIGRASTACPPVATSITASLGQPRVQSQQTLLGFGPTEFIIDPLVQAGVPWLQPCRVQHGRHAPPPWFVRCAVASQVGA
jgi:hypothetical protein